MAFGSLLALLDDIATVLDDVAAMSKLAAKKTTGVLGDDLALNAQQVSGIRAERELPVVWAVTKGSLRNKLILVPAALAISAVAPWAVMWLLMLGGAYLCFEGAEKILHSLLHRHESHEPLTEALSRSAQDLLAFEQEKVRGAIRTDFILSAEIIVITLGSVADSGFMTQVLVVSVLAVAFTFGVYGIVAAIVKMDDVGFWLAQKSSAAAQILGQGLLRLAPVLMKVLSVVGTVAMFLVGGGIILHGLHPLAEAAHSFEHWMLNGLPDSGAVTAVVGSLTSLLTTMAAGLLAGVLLVAVVSGVQKLRGRNAAQ